MATQVDPLRSTLDHLALDPRARSDRPYLITMLRRLGYSEAEIAHYLGEQQPEAPAPPPEPEPAPAPARAPLPEEPGERVIEIEYTGPGLRPFQLVVPMSEEEAANYDPLGLGAGLEAGTMTIEGDPDEDELSAFLEGEGAISFDDEFAGDDEEFEAESDRDNEEIAVKDEEEFLSFEEDTDGPGSPAADDDAFGEQLDEVEGPGGFEDDAFADDSEAADAADAVDAPFDPEDAEAADEPPFQKGRKLVTFSAVPLKEATVRRMEHEPFPQETAAAEAGGDDEDREALGWDTDTDGAESWDPEPEWDAAAAPAGYWYNDWLLHSREEDDDQGGRQRVYFFAKGQSPNGTPADMPEGYEVATNKETGLPYLRPIGDESDAAARKRIRMRRVQASSQEEAEEALRREGRNVLGSMPVDVKQHEEDET